MRTATTVDVRQNFKEIMEEVHDNHEVLLIPRPNKKDMVIMSLEDYNALEETAYLMGNKANAIRLLQSIEKAEKGNLITR